MKRILKIIFIILVVISLVGSSIFLFIKNNNLNKAYEAATQQVTQLQSKLEAVGTFVDVLTVKTKVKMGQEIKEDDLVLVTIPSSSVPSNVIVDKSGLVGNYYRIEIDPGIPLTSSLITKEEYIGSVYDRDIFLDSLPIGTAVGDYVDIRVVLPGGDELVAFPHKRINAKFEDAVKFRFDEADLWIYTSMMVDRALYKHVGMKVYATKYNDPGSHDKTMAYYPVRSEVIDIMNISPNLTDVQKSRMFNDNLRKAIDTKLSYYADPLNTDSGKLASGVNDEETRVKQAVAYYEAIIRDLTGDGSNQLEDPNNITDTSNEDSQIGTLNPSDVYNDGIQTEGGTDGLGNNSVIPKTDYLDNLGNDLNGDETPIQ